jgi:hypothetical protein
MTSCSGCDARTWLVDGEPAALRDVLAAVPSRRRQPEAA